MGATESAQQDGKPEEDAIAQEHNVEVNAEEADQNLEVKVNGRIYNIFVAFRDRAQYFMDSK